MALKTAFCCLTLRTGTLIVGWVSLIMVIFHAILVIVSDTAEKGEKKILDLASGDYYDRYESWRGRSEFFRGERLTTIVKFSFYAASAVAIVILVNLLYGTYTRRAGFLLPYLVVVGILGGVATFAVIHLYIAGYNWLILLYKYISVPFIIYFLFIVGSHYGELRHSKDHEVKSEAEA